MFDWQLVTILKHLDCALKHIAAFSVNHMNQLENMGVQDAEIKISGCCQLQRNTPPPAIWHTLGQHRLDTGHLPSGGVLAFLRGMHCTSTAVPSPTVSPWPRVQPLCCHAACQGLPLRLGGAGKSLKQGGEVLGFPPENRRWCWNSAGSTGGREKQGRQTKGGVMEGRGKRRLDKASETGQDWGL